MTTTNVQQVMTQAIVGAMTVNIMATAMGIMMGTLGTGAYTVAPSELKGTQEAVKQLRLAFGANVVDKAVKNVGVDSMLTLAQETERIIIADMTTKYGTPATEAALAAAPPGDIVAAREIAELLARRAAGRPGGVSAWLEKAPVAEKVKVVATAKRRSAGAHPAQPVLDTLTGIQYKSHYAAGKALAQEFGQDPMDTHTWFQVVMKAPKDRFKNIGVLSPSKPISTESAEPPKV